MAKQQTGIIEITMGLRAALAPLVARQMEAVRHVYTAMQPMIEHAEQHPEVWDQWRRERDAEAQLGSCHCLCGLHREQAEGVCTGQAAQGVAMLFDSPTFGPTAVRMCRPCAQANAERRAAVLA
ncbi:hypothetical protein [Streptomyces sp. NPDC004250]|uniref:hypothetical protein n=1 Tax=Streptomyces sp. NPDC004250 TaxID=3364692 RepID=UPI0036C79279